MTAEQKAAELALIDKKLKEVNWSIQYHQEHLKEEEMMLAFLTKRREAAEAEVVDV